MAGLRIIIMGSEETRTKLSAMPQQVSRAMDQAMARSLDVVYRKVMKNLTGAVLRVKTGRLRQSIQSQVNPDHSGTIGTNVEYAAAHEYGYSGAIQVPGYTRHRAG